jgi:hypothetical protein
MSCRCRATALSLNESSHCPEHFQELEGSILDDPPFMKLIAVMIINVVNSTVSCDVDCVRIWHTRF